MKVVIVPCDKGGNIDVTELRMKVLEVGLRGGFLPPGNSSDSIPLAPSSQ